jgi:predicted MFS family arabinose efflux permease
MSRLGLYYAAFFADALLRRILTYAVVIYGVEQLGGGRWAGLLYFCLVVPYLLSVHAGCLIDRRSKNRLLQTTAAGAMVLMLILAGADFSGLPIAGAATFVFLTYGILSAFAFPALIAAAPDVAPPDKAGHATVMINTLSMLCHVCAPLMTGLLRVTLSWPSFFVALAGLAGVKWLTLRAVRLPDRPGAEGDGRAHLRELYQFFRSDRTFASLMLAIACFSGLIIGPLEMLMPLFAEKGLQLSPVPAGAFLAVGGVGLALGAFAALRLAGRPREGAWLTGSAAGGAVLIGAMTWVPAPAAFVLVFAGGMLGGVFSSLGISWTQRLAPAPLRGRIMGLFTLILGAPPAMGGALAGAMTDALGPVATIRLFFFAAAVVFAVFFAMLKALRHSAHGAPLNSPASA